MTSPATPLAAEQLDVLMDTPVAEASAVATPSTAAVTASCSTLELEERIAAQDADWRRLLELRQIISRRIETLEVQLNSDREQLSRRRDAELAAIERWADSVDWVQNPLQVARTLGQRAPYEHQVETVARAAWTPGIATRRALGRE